MFYVFLHYINKGGKNQKLYVLYKNVVFQIHKKWKECEYWKKNLIIEPIKKKMYDLKLKPIVHCR